MVIVALAAGLAGGTVLFQRSSEAEQLDQCRSNLLQLFLGLQNYISAEGSYPPATVPSESLPPDRRLSWLTVIYAFLEQFFWLLNQSEAWDSEANLVTRGCGTDGQPCTLGRVDVFCCPAAPGSSDEHMPGWTWYVGIAGVGTDAATLPEGHPRAGIFGYDRRTPPSAIKDGAATTLLIVETGLDNGPWTAGGPATVRGLDPDRQPYLGADRQFGGLHRQGAMVLMADGSVRLIRETTEPRVFEALATIAGGEALPAEWHSRWEAP
jgi:prepilin-type processing-associated H-X9-DG protein